MPGEGDGASGGPRRGVAPPPEKEEEKRKEEETEETDNEEKRKEEEETEETDNKEATKDDKQKETKIRETRRPIEEDTENTAGPNRPAPKRICFSVEFNKIYKKCNPLAFPRVLTE